MIQKKDLPKAIALVIFVVLLGGYYERMSVETRTWMLPLGLFVVGGYVIARFKQVEYELRVENMLAYKVTTQEASFADSSGNERIYISSENSVITLYDADRAAFATLELSNRKPLFKLVGQKGSVELTFNEDGMPAMNFRDEAEKIIWSAR